MDKGKLILIKRITFDLTTGEECRLRLDDLRFGQWHLIGSTYDETTGIVTELYGEGRR